jgi:hypothetical protein
MLVSMGDSCAINIGVESESGERMVPEQVLRTV